MPNSPCRIELQEPLFIQKTKPQGPLMNWRTTQHVTELEVKRWLTPLTLNSQLTWQHTQSNANTPRFTRPPNRPLSLLMRMLHKARLLGVTISTRAILMRLVKSRWYHPSMLLISYDMLKQGFFFFKTHGVHFLLQISATHLASSLPSRHTLHASVILYIYVTITSSQFACNLIIPWLNLVI